MNCCLNEQSIILIELFAHVTKLFAQVKVIFKNFPEARSYLLVYSFILLRKNFAEQLGHADIGGLTSKCLSNSWFIARLSYGI